MPGSRPVMRPGGGFRQSFGSFDETHLEDNSSQAAASQKLLSQQQTNSAQTTTGGSALKPGGSSVPGGVNPLAGAGAEQQTKPREVGTIPEELFARPAQDVAKGLSDFFDLNKILGINPVADTPEQQAKKRQTHQRWQKLDQEQQARARQLFQEKQARKQKEEQERQQKQRAEAEKESQTLVLPSSPKKGPVGPSGSKKQKASQVLQHNRKTLSNVQGAG